MTATKSTLKPPENLPKAARKFWLSITGDYVLEAHHVELLSAACHQLARMVQARELLDEHGLTEKDRFGQTREHPAVGIERSASLAFQRITRELGLDIEPASALRGPSRPGTRN